MPNKYLRNKSSRKEWMSEQIDGLCFCSFTINSGNRSSNTGPSVVEISPGVFGIHVWLTPPMQRICPHSQLLPAPSHSQRILGKAEAASWSEWGSFLAWQWPLTWGGLSEKGQSIQPDLLSQDRTNKHREEIQKVPGHARLRWAACWGHQAGAI